MEKMTVVLVTYRDHNIDRRHGDRVQELQRSGVTVVEVTGSPHIDIARSLLASSALGLGADVAVFIDSDIVFEPGDVERLADVARETRGVVGAPYSLRAMGNGLGLGIVPKDDHVVFFEGGGLYDVSGVIGMGFTAIHREVLERIIALPEYSSIDTQGGPCWPFFQKLVVGGRWLHEDASFCHAARLVGAPTQADTRFRVTHIGTYEFRIEDSSQRAKVDQQSYKVRAQLKT